MVSLDPRSGRLRPSLHEGGDSALASSRPGAGVSLGTPLLSAATLTACGVALDNFGLRDSGVGSGSPAEVPSRCEPHRSRSPVPTWLPRSPKTEELVLMFILGKLCAYCLRTLVSLLLSSWPAGGAPCKGEVPGSWGLLVAHPASGVVARNPTLPQATSPWH